MYMGTVGHACVWGQRMRSGAFPCHLPPNCSETGASLKLELTVLAALAHHSASRLLHPSLCVTSICCHIQLVMWILGIQARICLYSKHLRTEPSLQPTYTFLIRIENHPEVTVNILEDMFFKTGYIFFTPGWSWALCSPWWLWFSVIVSSAEITGRCYHAWVFQHRGSHLRLYYAC